MFLIWATLLFAVRSNNANTGNLPEVTAETLCDVVPCKFSTDRGLTFESAVWCKCKANWSASDVMLDSNSTDPNAQSGFEEQGPPVQTDLRQRKCSIIITKSDSGLYELRVLNGTMKGATIPVKGLKPTVKIPPLTEGHQATLICTAPGLCSGSRPEITWTWRRAGESDSSHIAGNITAFKIENVTAVTQRHSSTLTFNPSAEHHGTEVTCKVSLANNITTEETVTLNVTFLKKPEISGKTTVKEGDTLNLTCSVNRDTPYVFTWTKRNWNKNLKNKSGTHLRNDTGMATLVILNVTTEHAGKYICTAKHLNDTLMTEVNIKVKLSPKILTSSGCINQSGILTCMCISQGSPLPTIKWPLLENHTEYSNHIVNSTIALTVRGHSTVVECISSNKNGKVKKNLIVNKVEDEEEEEEEGPYMELLRTVTRLEMIIAFLVGALLSAVVCCLATRCRKKQRTYGNLALETLEMVTSHEDPVVDAGQAAEDDQAVDPGVAEVGGAVAAGKSEVEYSNLDFSLIKRQSTAEVGATQGTPETEYAEIKKEKVKGGQDEGKEEMMGEDEETKHFVLDEDSESTALYSTVEDVMSQI